MLIEEPSEDEVLLQKELTNKQGELAALDRQGAQQARPESPMVTLNLHAYKEKIHKLHPR